MLKANEAGASALFIASTLILLMGMAAIAIDVGAGFNERRQTQTAADVAVMSGAIEASFLTPSNAEIAEQALRIARSNTRQTFGDPNDPNDPVWVNLWRSCTDPGRPNEYQPLPEPAGWSGVTTESASQGHLDCISRTASFLRLRMPVQTVDTTFGRLLGVAQLNTSAIAVALISTGDNNPPVVPYGISGAASSVELCFGEAPSGIAIPPCDGPSSGTFGVLASEFFGDFYGTPDCGQPGATEIATQTALGLDHLLAVWTNPDGLAITQGQSWPGNNTVLSYSGVNRDACDKEPPGAGPGIAVPVDSVPINTARVDVGFPGDAIESGLVSNDTFYGQRSRLQQAGEHLVGVSAVSNTTRDVVKRRQGSNNVVWELDNHGPWDYLLPMATGVPPTCDPASYPVLASEFQKASHFNSCLADYELLPGSKPVIFDDYLDRSPRFVWAPQYWFTVPTTGFASWVPIHSFRMAFIAGTYFNCSGTDCAVVFYPDAHQESELCDASGQSNCSVLSLAQFSAWVLPDEAVRDRIRNAFPGGQTPFEPELYR